MNEFMEIARDAEYGHEIDIEQLDETAMVGPNGETDKNQLTQQQVNQILQEAEQMIDELVEVEERLIRFALGQ